MNTKTIYDHALIIRLFNEGVSCKKIADNHNIPIASVQRVVKSKNLRKPLSQNEKEIIKTEYLNGLIPKNISDKYNFRISQVYKVLREYNILKLKKEIRKFNYDINYFDKIDTKEKAYFLGLLYADGCNTRAGLSIGLVEKDKYILEKFKNSIKYTGDLLFCKSKKTNQNNQYKLAISAVDLSYKLNNVGIIPNKSLTVSFPEWLDINLYSHFIRGYFDGDGCITSRLNSKTINIVGTKSMIETINSFFTEIYKIKTNKVRFYKNVYHLNITNKKGIEIFYKEIYKDCEDLFLIRKKEKF